MTFEITKFDKFPEDEYNSLYDETLRQVRPFLQWQEHLDETGKQKLARLGEYMQDDYKLRLGVLHEGKLIAAQYSFQVNASEVMMAMSTVRPEFRGKGIYTALARRVLEETREAGFQAVLSKHHLTNNPILIAKLKLGFTIYAIESHAVHGNLLNMVYHHNEQMKKSQRFRAGELFLFSEDDIYSNYGLPNSHVK